MTLSWEHDERDKNPKKDGYRLGRFKAGWADYVNGNPIDTETLSEKLTWQNLGYRMAALLKAKFTHDYDEEAEKLTTVQQAIEYIQSHAKA